MANTRLFEVAQYAENHVEYIDADDDYSFPIDDQDEIILMSTPTPPPVHAVAAPAAPLPIVSASRTSAIKAVSGGLEYTVHRELERVEDSLSSDLESEHVFLGGTDGGNQLESDALDVSDDEQAPVGVDDIDRDYRCIGFCQLDDGNGYVRQFTDDSASSRRGDSVENAIDEDGDEPYRYYSYYHSKYIQRNYTRQGDDDEDEMEQDGDDDCGYDDDQDDDEEDDDDVDEHDPAELDTASQHIAKPGSITSASNSNSNSSSSKKKRRKLKHKQLGKKRNMHIRLGDTDKVGSSPKRNYIANKKRHLIQYHDATEILCDNVEMLGAEEEAEEESVIIGGGFESANNSGGSRGSRGSRGTPNNSLNSSKHSKSGSRDRDDSKTANQNHSTGGSGENTGSSEQKKSSTSLQSTSNRHTLSGSLSQSQQQRSISTIVTNTDMLTNSTQTMINPYFPYFSDSPDTGIDYEQFGIKQDDSSEDASDDESSISELDSNLLGSPDQIYFQCVDDLVPIYKNDRQFASLPYLNVTCLNQHNYVDAASRHDNQLRSATDSETPKGRKPDESMSPNIRIMSWNILADGVKYALSARHEYVTDRQYLQWSYRSMRITASIHAYNPDIICLQEVTQNMYHHYVSQQFNISNGYQTLHVPLKTMYAQSDTLIYKSPRFQLLQYEIVSLGKLACGSQNVSGPVPNMYFSFFQQTSDHAIIALFRDRDSDNNKEFVVITTHFYWEPSRPHIKSVQAYLLNTHLVSLLCRDSKWRLSSHLVPDDVYLSGDEQAIMDRVPVMFCCDANSLPCKVACYGPDLYVKSGVTQIMHHNELDVNHLDHPVQQFNLRSIRASFLADSMYNPSLIQQQTKALEQTMKKSWKLPVNMRWKSVYNEYNKQRLSSTSKPRFFQDQRDNAFEPIFTNRVPQFTGTIDYIFYSSTSVQIQSVLKMPYEQITPYQQAQLQSNYMYQRYIMRRQQKFQQFKVKVGATINDMKSIKLRLSDQTLFAGYIRKYCLRHDRHIPPEICSLFTRFYISLEQEIKIADCHDSYLNAQRYWQCVYNDCDNDEYHNEASKQPVITPKRSNHRHHHHHHHHHHQVIDIDKINAYNYPFMPNFKDPSDHFALCCDFKII